MSSGSSSNLGFGKSGNNVPVLELSEYFRIENEPCVKRNLKKCYGKRYDRENEKKKRKVNTRVKIPHSNTVKPWRVHKA